MSLAGEEEGFVPGEYVWIRYVPLGTVASGFQLVVPKREPEFTPITSIVRPSRSEIISATG
jgi:hypothetical protein